MPIETVDTFGEKLAIQFTEDDFDMMPHTLYLKKIEVERILEELAYGEKKTRMWAKDLGFTITPKR